MSVQSVNGQNYGYNSQINLADKKMVEDAILMMPDNLVFKLADEQAKRQVKDKSKRFGFGLTVAAIPLVYGLSGALTTRGRLCEVFPAESGSLVNKFINATCKDLKGAATRMATGTGITAKVGGAVLIGYATIALTRGLFNSTKKTKEFADNHPGLAFITEIAAIFAGTALIPKGLGSLFEKVSPERIAKMSAKVTKLGKKFNDRNVVKSAQNLWHGMLTKSPRWLKKAGKFGIAIAPPVCIAGLVIGTVRHSMKYSRALAENINVIRGEQKRILEERQKEANPTNTAAV